MSSKKAKWAVIVAVLAICVIGAGIWVGIAMKASKTDNNRNSSTQKVKEKTLQLVDSDGDSTEYYTSTFDSYDNIYSQKKSASVMRQIKELQEQHAYTAQNPLLIRNAFGTNECSYYIAFKTEEAVYLEYTVSAKESSIPDFTRVAKIASGEAVTKEHAYQLIGFVPGVENDVTLRLLNENGKLVKEHVLKGLTVEATNQIQAKLETEDGTSSSDLTDGLFAVFTSNVNQSDEGYDILCYDNDGILRSVYPVKAYRAVRIVQVGENIMYAVSAHKLALVSPLGQVLRTYTLGDYTYHHDYQYDEATNSLYLLANDLRDENHYIEDIVISLNLETKEVKEVIDFKDLFPDMYPLATPANDEDLNDKISTDWIHFNSLSFVGSANEMVFSSREYSAIIRVKNVLTKPEIKYIIGDDFIFKGFDSEKYLLGKDLANGDFKLQYGQHDVMYEEDENLEEGCYYLTMYNNNAGWSHSREDYDWSQVEGVGNGLMAASTPGVSSYYYKYLVNENEGTFRLVESFPVEYSGIVSNAGYVGENIVTSSGTAKVFAEYTKEGELIRKFYSGRQNFNYRVFKYDFL